MPSDKCCLAKKISILILAAVFLITPGFCEVIHDISIDGDTARVNSLLILRSNTAIDYWDLSITLPQESRLESVRDELGEASYNISKNVLSIRTNARKSSSRIVNITYSISNPKKTQGLSYIQLNLFGFSNDSTYAKVRPELPYVFAPNAITERGVNETKCKAIGPINIIIAYGGSKQSAHYFTNSDIDLQKAEELYPIIEGVTGLKVPVKFGIAVLPESEYLEDYKDWSAGTFNGLILVKENDNVNEVLATVIHETVHGFNQFALDWDMTNITWFDEGTASYITSAAYRILGERQAEIFGEKKVWREKNLIYTLPPKKTPEELYNYYKSGRTYMYYWYPQSTYDREFGYAYSELFIREYVKDYGNELQEVYRKLLEINQTVYESDEGNRIMIESLGTEFKPCYSPDLGEIEKCTKELNEMSFKIPSAGGKEIGQFVEAPQIPETESNYYLSYFQEIFQNLLDSLGQIYNFILEMIG